MEEASKNHLITIFLISDSLQTLHLQLFELDDTLIQRLDITNYTSAQAIIKNNLIHFYCTATNSNLNIEHHFDVDFAEVGLREGKRPLKKQFSFFKIIFTLQRINSYGNIDSKNTSLKEQQTFQILAFDNLRKIQKKIINKIQFQSLAQNTKMNHENLNSLKNSKKIQITRRPTEKKIQNSSSKNIDSSIFQPTQKCTEPMLNSEKKKYQSSKQNIKRYKIFHMKTSQFSNTEEMKQFQTFLPQKNILPLHTIILKKLNQQNIYQKCKASPLLISSCQTPFQRYSHNQFRNLLQDNTQRNIKIQNQVLNILGKSIPMQKSAFQLTLDEKMIINTNRNGNLRNSAQKSPYRLTVSRNFRKIKRS